MLAAATLCVTYKEPDLCVFSFYLKGREGDSVVGIQGSPSHCTLPRGLPGLRLGTASGFPAGVAGGKPLSHHHLLGLRMEMKAEPGPNPGSLVWNSGSPMEPSALYPMPVSSEQSQEAARDEEVDGCGREQPLSWGRDW